MNFSVATDSKNLPVRRRSLRNLLVLGWFGALILVTLASVSTANGQSVLTGTISGTIIDPNGAVVVGARVQITSETTHFVTPATSNETGLYTARFLNPDTYDVNVTATGFAPAQQIGVVLIPGDIKQTDFKLSVGSTSTTVQVTVNTDELSTGTATLETVIPSKLIENTVNLGDNVFYLATRTVGMYSNFTQGSEMSNWTPNSNGAVGSFNGVGFTQINVDGTYDLINNGTPGKGSAGYNPPLYSVQELSVKTSGYDAQDGHNNGGIQDAVIKSGTEQFHGNGYMVNGNKLFNANRWDRKGGATNNPQYPRIPTDWDQQGFAVTGPLLIPKLTHGNHHTFFMVAYEHYYDYRGVVSSGPSYFSVPTVKERNGDFSELGAAGGTGNGGNIIYDPATTVIGNTQPAWCAGNPAANGQPAGCFPGERESFTQEYGEGPGNPAYCNGDANCIPQARWNTAGAVFAGATAPTGYKQGIWPLPNTNSSTPATPYLNNYFPANYATNVHYHSTIARVDHQFNESNKMHVTFAKSAINNIANAEAGFPDDEIGSAWVPQITTWTMGMIDYNRILSPSEVLNIHIGGMYHPYHLIRGGSHYDPVNVGITGSLPIDLKNFPGASFSGVGGNYMTLQNGVGADDYNSYIEGTALFAKSLARHNLKAGFDMIYNRDDIAGTGSTSTLGTFASTNQFTQENAGGTASRVTGFGDGVASLLLGYPANNNGGSSTNPGSTTIQPKPAFRYNYYALYLQDDWRTTNRLSLNLGVRFDYDSPVTEKNNKMNLGFDATDPNPFCLPNVLGTAIASCTAPAGSAAVPQGYLGGLVFESSSVHLPYQHELWDRFQPRIGFAYRLTNRDVIRGGVGVTFSNNPANQQVSGFSATTTFNGSINNFFTPPTCTAAQGGDANGFCTLTNPFPNGVVQPTASMLGLSTFLGQSISANDRHRVYPKTTIYSLDVQHQFPSQILFDVAYHGAYTTGVGITKNIDAVPACYYLGGGCPGAGINSILTTNVPNPMAGLMPASSSLNGATIQQNLLYVPYPEFSGVNITYTQANGQRLGTFNYNALFVDLTKRTSHGLTFHVAATIAKTMDKQAYANPQDAQPAHYEDQQPNHFLAWDASYAIPSIPTDNKIVRSIFDGWQWANSMNWQQQNGAGWPGNTWPTGANPKAVHQQLNAYNQAGSHWFNNCYIPLISSATTTSGPVWGAPQAPNAQGVEGPCNAGEQPAFKQMPQWALNTVSGSAEMSNSVRFLIGVYYNTSLARTFPIHDRLSLEFRGDFFNPLNYTVLQGSINEGVTSSNFGTMTGLTQYNDPRFIRLRAILNF